MPSRKWAVAMPVRQPTITTLNKVSVSHEDAWLPAISEFDRVLGGGLVTGSVVLIGGDPGIGKSTILLQTATHMASCESSALYVTGENCCRKSLCRAHRLELPTEHLKVMADCVERFVRSAQDALLWPF